METRLYYESNVIVNKFCDYRDLDPRRAESIKTTVRKKGIKALEGFFFDLNYLDLGYLKVTNFLDLKMNNIREDFRELTPVKIILHDILPKSGHEFIKRELTIVNPWKY